MTTSHGDGGIECRIMLSNPCGDVVRDDVRVRADAVDKRGPARPLEPHAHRVDAAERRDAVVMTQLARLATKAA